MSDEEHFDDAHMDAVSSTPTDFFDHDPSRAEKIEMRKANRRPSDWLNLLCKDWASENHGLVESTDTKFLQYKPYLKGYLTSQLLCRLSLPVKDSGLDGNSVPMVDFWSILGVQDEFDKAYIVAQIERFCALYNIRGNVMDDAVDTLFSSDLSSPDHAATLAAAAAAGLPNHYQMDASTAAAAAAAAAAVTDVSKLTKKQVSEVSKAHRMAKDAEKALENERRQNMKREQRRLSMERKDQKAREREAVSVRKSSERVARETGREMRRRKKLEIRVQRETFANEQKEAALKRAAELVASNRVPIEITRGAAAAKAAANAVLAASGGSLTTLAEPEHLLDKKQRSAIVVSTAADLNQIVTHSKNLWAKYNAIAKEHNQKVNWITVAKELGIHVKVREKYARMHSRAEQRGFQWKANGHWKIKDNPDIFMEPTQAEQKAKMPPPPPDTNTTVLVEDNKEVVATDEAAVAAAAAVVDAAGVSGCHVAHVPSNEEDQGLGLAAAAAVAATLVADPTQYTKV